MVRRREDYVAGSRFGCKQLEILPFSEAVQVEETVGIKNLGSGRGEIVNLLQQSEHAQGGRVGVERPELQVFEGKADELPRWRECLDSRRYGAPKPAWDDDREAHAIIFATGKRRVGLSADC
jgi:hypothetical protein